MRSAHPSAWFHRSNKKSQTAEPANSSLNHLPLHYLPSSDRTPAAPNLFTSLHLTAHNKDSRPSTSASSFRSAYSAATGSHRSNSHTQEFYSHPFASMVNAPLPVVSSHDPSDEEEECPVCLEPLSFSFRLPGEKPHIVPECGHALHEVSALLFFVPLLACKALAAYGHSTCVSHSSLVRPAVIISLFSTLRWELRSLPSLSPCLIARFRIMALGV